MIVRNIIMKICCVYLLFVGVVAGIVLLLSRFGSNTHIIVIVDNVLRINPANALLVLVGGIGLGMLIDIILKEKK